jgi:putative chitinase
MNPITATQLSQLFPDADNDYLAQVASELNTDPSKYGLDTPLRCAHFFAQVMQETGAGLEAQSELLRYDSHGLQTQFKYYRLPEHQGEAAQDAFVRNPATNHLILPSPEETAAKEEVIANKAYANRPGSGNGDIASGDGWRFRGRGFFQVTFRSGYAALAKQYNALYGAGNVDFEATPDLVAQFPYTVRSAVCYWIQHGLPKLADKGSLDANVDTITNVINANTPSKELRCENFHLAIKVFQ